jgi:hypothetical protein
MLLPAPKSRDKKKRVCKSDYKENRIGEGCDKESNGNRFFWCGISAKGK